MEIFWQDLVYSINTIIKGLGNVASKIRSVTKVFLGLSDVMFTEILASNILQFDCKSPLFRWFDFDFKIINIWWFCPSLTTVNIFNSIKLVPLALMFVTYLH